MSNKGGGNKGNSGNQFSGFANYNSYSSKDPHREMYGAMYMAGKIDYIPARGFAVLNPEPQASYTTTSNTNSNTQGGGKK